MLATDLIQVRRMIESEFNEMPGMRLTLAQARRLWCLREDRCAVILQQLVDEGFLIRDTAGRYGRAVDGHVRSRRELSRAAVN